MQTTASPDSCDRPILLAHLEPRATRCRPSKPLHQFVGIVEEFLDTVGLRREAFDVLGLHFFDHGKHVPGVPVEDWEDRAMAYRTVGAKKYYRKSK